MNKCEICKHRLTNRNIEPCASCDTMVIIQLRARIAELEAAAQWHPASEPPEEEGNTGMSRAVLIQEKSGDCYTDWYQHDQKRWHFSKRIVRWRDLPPMPEEPKQ
jgi:hypothetical protein